MKGSPPTGMNDFGTVEVRAPNRVASPPARIAMTGLESSPDSYPPSSFIVSAARYLGEFQEDLRSMGQVVRLKIRLGFVNGAHRGMVFFHPNRPHSRRAAALNIGRPIPDYPRLFQRQAKSVPCFEDEVRRRLSAFAKPGVTSGHPLRMVIAVIKLGERNPRSI